MKKSSTALTVTGGKGVALPYAFDPTAAKEKMKKRGVSERKFPGDPYYFKRGKFFSGSHKKDQRVRVADGSKFVFNPAFAVECWQSFPEGRPQFSDLVYVADPSGVLPGRDEMGQTDKALWKQGDDGRPMDPWSRLLVIPVRSKGSNEINHFTASSVSARIALERLINDWLDQFDEHKGELPFVSLNAEDRESKDGTKEFSAPVFKIVGWVKAEKGDMPGVLGFVTEVEHDEDTYEDANEDEKPRGKSKAAKREDDEDEAPRQHHGKGKPARDEEENDEEEDEKPRSKKASRRDDDEDDDGQDAKAIMARNKKRAAAKEDDDEKPKTSRRRRMSVEDNE